MTQILRTALQFAVAGPLIGGAVIFTPIMVVDHGRGAFPLPPGGLVFVMLGVIGLSYLFGLVPAVLTGGLLGVFRSKGAHWPWRRMAVCTGVAIGFMCGIALNASNPSNPWPIALIEPLFLAVPSGLAALVCSCIFKPVLIR